MAASFFAVYALGKVTVEHPGGAEALLSRPGPGGCFAPTIAQGLSRQTNEAAADALPPGRRRRGEYFSPEDCGSLSGRAWLPARCLDAAGLLDRSMKVV